MSNPPLQFARYTTAHQTIRSPFGSEEGGGKVVAEVADR